MFMGISVWYVNCFRLCGVAAVSVSHFATHILDAVFDLSNVIYT